MVVFVYVLIAIGSLWGLLTFFALAQEEKEIKELIQSARNATRHSHGSE